jgi:ParB family chromosome partitioning protein
MSRPSLGRGLAALIPERFFDEPSPNGGREALQMVPLDRIKVNPLQPRLTFDGAALEQLAESIRTHGIITPLLVRRDERGDGFVLIAGERRLRASGMAGLELVPVCVRDDVGSREQLELALVENIQREDLDAIETAESYHRLCEEFGLTQADVARKVGKDRATVANAIRLLKLPPFALEDLRAGKISAGHGKALLSLSDDEVLRRALREVMAKELSVRATERLVSQLLKPGAGKAKTETTPALQRLGDALTRDLGTKVKIEGRPRGDRGRIVIEFYSRDELDRIVERMATA